MNIDFHVHGLLSKRKDFNINFFLEEIAYAKSVGIDGIVLCEHFNARAFEDIHSFLCENYPYENDKYVVDGVYVFPAIEVSIKENGHVILVGDRESILEIYRRLKGRWCKENMIPFKELLDMADEYGCYKIGAHPYRRGHKLFDKPTELISRLDALDLNGKDIYKKGLEMAKSELMYLAKRNKKVIVTGSDSHTPLQIGVVKTNIHSDCISFAEVMKNLLTNNYDIEVSDNLNFRVYSSKILKRYLIGSKEYDKDTVFRV